MSTKVWVVAILLLVVVIVGSQAMFAINETEQAIVLQLGEYKGTIDKPGLHFKIPFIQVVHRMETRTLFFDVRPAEFLTLDKERLVVDSYTRWRILDPHLFFKAVRNEHGAKLRIGGIVTSRLREELARHNLWDIIGVRRKPIMEVVGRHVDELARREFGIEIIDVRMKRVDLPEEVQAAVFSRMIAERNRISKEHRAKGEQEAMKLRAGADREVTIILAEAEKESRILKGEGDAKAAAIYADAFNEHPEFFSFVRTLRAYEEFLAGDTTLIFSSETYLFRHLKAPGYIQKQ
ncbi:MAG: Modulator of FtsH protease HflC [Syntrophomonadaceae bacterium]|nr:Modulator of FtsH protease HflC [Bacillota bacterium]